MDNKRELRELCDEVKRLCEKERVEFLFITEGYSVWNVLANGHLKQVKDYHKMLEDIEMANKAD